MSNNSIVEHRGNYFYIEFREEYLIICLKSSYKKPVKEGGKCKSSPYCKALILAIMESWTNEKRGKGEDLAIYMTYPQWIEAMYGMFGRNVIIDSLDELIGDELISREPHKMYGKDTYKYRLNYQELNQRIKLLPEKSPKQTRPQVNAFTSKRDNPKNASKSKRVSGLQVNEDAFTSGHNIESTNLPGIESKEGTNATADSTNPNASLSFPPSFFSLSPEDQLAYLETETARLRQTMDAKEITSSSKPSSTPTLSTELPTGVDNEQAVKPTDASLIVNGTTSNRQVEAAPAQGEPVTTRNTSNEANTGINDALEPEQRRIAGYLEELEFDFDLTPLNKQHLTKLAKRIKSVEQMKSLKAFTENQELLKGKTIYLGNLANANNLNGWRQSEQAKQRAEVQKSAPASPSKLTSMSGMRNYSVDPEVQPVIAETERKLPVFKLKSREKRETIAQ